MTTHEPTVLYMKPSDKLALDEVAADYGFKVVDYRAAKEHLDDHLEFTKSHKMSLFQTTIVIGTFFAIGVAVVIIGLMKLHG